MIMIKITMSELEKIAFDSGYLPYEFFMQVNAIEAVVLLLKQKTVYKVNNKLYTEM